MLKAEIIRPKYQSIGWVEQEHMWNTCNCIDIARELVPYEDDELLVHDMEVGESIKYKTSDGEDNMEIYRFEVAEAVSRLAAASIISSIDGLEVEFFFEDLSSVAMFFFTLIISIECSTMSIFLVRVLMHIAK